MKSNELPIPPDRALDKLGEATAHSAAALRPWPKLSPRRRALLIGCFAAAAATVVWLYLRYHSYVAFLPIVAAAIVFAFFGHIRRCPQCKSRLVCHEEAILGRSQYRVLFQCAHCGTTWNSGVLRDRELEKM
jgi:hypothetical protein